MNAATSEAYAQCHELMMLNKGYVPTENATHTYILLQICDTESALGLHGMLINPALPERSKPSDFLRMPLDQRIGIVAMGRIIKLVQKVTNEIQEIEKLTSNHENWDEAVKRLEKLTQQIQRSSE